MKNWKLSIIAILSFFALATTVVFTSCEQDPCIDLDCKNGGSCSDGYCQCPTGFEGAECEYTSASRFVGMYAGNIKCGNFPNETDTVVIELIEAPNKVRMTIAGGNTSVIIMEGTAATPETYFVGHSDEAVEVHAYATVDGDALYVYMESLSKLNPQRQICRFSGRKLSQ